jgi:hypothetical protein
MKKRVLERIKKNYCNQLPIIYSYLHITERIKAGVNKKNPNMTISVKGLNVDTLIKCTFYKPICKISHE